MCDSHGNGDEPIGFGKSLIFFERSESLCMALYPKKHGNAPVLLCFTVYNLFIRLFHNFYHERFLFVIELTRTL